MGTQCAADELGDGGIFHRGKEFVIAAPRLGHVPFDPPLLFFGLRVLMAR